MKILVATAERQGERSDDFYWAEDGEIVFRPFECDRDMDIDVNVEGSAGCGCRIAMSGAASLKSTTTFKVVDVDVTRGQMEAKLLATLSTSGWLKYSESVGESEELANDLVDELLKVAAEYPAGTVLERRGDDYRAR